MDVLEKVVKVPVDVAQLYVGGWEEDVAAMLEGRQAAAAALGGAFQVCEHIYRRHIYPGVCVSSIYVFAYVMYVFAYLALGGAFQVYVSSIYVFAYLIYVFAYLALGGAIQGTQVTCVVSTEAQMLRPEVFYFFYFFCVVSQGLVHTKSAMRMLRLVARCMRFKVHSLLALLVQKYKY